MAEVRTGPKALSQHGTHTPQPPAGESALVLPSRRALLKGGLALVTLSAVPGLALAQRGGGGAIVFTRSRPPRDMVGNIRGWADGNRAANYEEDTTSHTWRVNFMAFLAGSPNAPELTLSWFHIERNNSRRYISNESVGLSSPTERIFFHSTVLHRAAGEFDPMERYEAVLAANDSSGQRSLARGTVQLNGQVERRGPGVVDFTQPNPTAR